ncbi:hypothetical protein Tco_1276289 [Tanacetum coccineum]
MKIGKSCIDAQLGEIELHWFATLSLLSALRRFDNENMLSRPLIDSNCDSKTKHGRMTKPYSPPSFIANCFNARYLKMVVNKENVDILIKPSTEDIVFINVAVALTIMEKCFVPMVDTRTYQNTFVSTIRDYTQWSWRKMTLYSVCILKLRLENIKAGEKETSILLPREIQSISLTGFPAQSIGSSNTDVFDSTMLAVLFPEHLQSRQHRSCKSSIPVLVCDVGQVGFSIFIVQYLKYHSDVLQVLRIMRRTLCYNLRTYWCSTSDFDFVLIRFIILISS